MPLKWIVVLIGIPILFSGCSNNPFDPYALAVNEADRYSVNGDLPILLKLPRGIMSGVLSAGSESGKYCKIASRNYFVEFNTYSNLAIRNVDYTENLPSVSSVLKKPDTEYVFTQTCSIGRLENRPEGTPSFTAHLTTNYF